MKKIVRAILIPTLIGAAVLLIQCSEEINAPSNSAPIISSIPTPVTRIGVTFADIALDQYIQDEDPDSLISWSLTPGNRVGGTIANRVLQLTPLDSAWVGYDQVMIVATDTDGATSHQSITCHVVNPDQWEQTNPDGTMTIRWSSESTTTAVVRFGHTQHHLLTEARSLLDADTSHQVRLLGIQSNQVTYYQAINYDLLGSVVFESPVDSFVASVVAPDDVFRVTMIDVRHGDGFLLVSPAGQIIMIDGGYGTRDPSWGGVWSGEGHPFALQYLQNQGIDHVDHMVETHHHMDHWGGLQDVYNAMPVDNYYSPESPGTMMVGHPWDIGDPTLTATVLNIDYPPGVPQSNTNNRTIVLRFVIGQISFLFTGDAEQDVELWEVATYGDSLRTNILKVSHHGSSDSSDPAFLDKVRPEIALISCAAGNPYGHPHWETRQALENIDAEILRTDEDGNITIRTDGAMTLEITR